MAQHIGKVAWFNSAKGFGFLKVPSGPDVFCHFSSVQKDGYKSLKEGEEVEFDIVTGSTGKLQAENVTPLQSKSTAA